MKFLHLIGTLNPAYGGPVEGLRQLASVHHETGNTMDIATLDGAEAPWLADYPVSVFPLGPAHLEYRYTPRLPAWLRQNASRYDGILVRGIWQYQSFATWKTLRDCAVPYFVYAHGALDPWFKRRYPFKHMKKWLYWPWAEYQVLRDARAVIFTSEEERISARDSFWLYRCNEAVVSYGTSVPPDDTGAQRAQFLDAHPTLRGKRLLLFLGRLHPKKGCDLVLRAFARILSGNPDWHLVMAGPDQIGWQKELENLAIEVGIEQQITWTGMLSGNEKWGSYRAADALILPSHSENFGIVVAEALACRLPVLISDKVNIWREIITAGGGFVSSDDLQGTSKMISDWVAQPESVRDAMRGSAEQCFLTHFKIETSARDLNEFLARNIQTNSAA